MNIVKVDALARGALLIDWAYSGNGKRLKLTPSDYVGIAGAYIGRGLPLNEMERDLATRLSSGIAARARMTLDLFDDCHGKGLWNLGAGQGDIRFWDRKLDRLYPAVNESYRLNSEEA